MAEGLSTFEVVELETGSFGGLLWIGVDNDNKFALNALVIAVSRRNRCAFHKRNGHQSFVGESLFDRTRCELPMHTAYWRKFPGVTDEHDRYVVMCGSCDLTLNHTTVIMGRAPASFDIVDDVYVCPHCRATNRVDLEWPALVWRID
jgi:hypothetical protein